MKSARRVLLSVAVIGSVVWSSAPGAPALAQRIFSDGPGVAIPGDSCVIDSGSDPGGGLGLGGVTRQITAAVAGFISDVDIGLQALHDFRSSLQVGVSYQPLGGSVIGPLRLAHGEPGAGPNLVVVFDSDAGDNCSLTCTPADACVTAPGPLCSPIHSLSAFDGAPAPGIFTLTICDRFATTTGSLETWSVIVSGTGKALDVDGNGAVAPLSDGLLAMRYSFGFRGATLTTGAVGAGCMRCTAEMIEAYLGFLSASAPFL